MKIKICIKKVPLLICILAVFILIGVEEQFQYKQEMLILESNNLLSNHHMLLSSDMNGDWKQRVTSKNKMRFFGELENNGNRHIVSFFATDYKHLDLPLRKGKCFTKPNSKEAIVGEEVQTYWSEQKEYYDFNGTSYNVIGKFGIAKDSPLKNTVLINDMLLFEQSDISITVDGKDLKNIKWLKGNVVENKGVERWFNASYFCKLVQRVTWMVILCCSFLLMYFYIEQTRMSRIIRVEIGIKQTNIFLNDIRNVAITVAILGILGGGTVIQKNVYFHYFRLSGIIFIMMLVAYCILFWKQSIKEKLLYV